MSVEAQLQSIAARHLEGQNSRLMWLVLIYDDGIEEHRQGTLLDASELAAAHDLTIAPTTGGWFHWVRSR